MTGSPRDRVVRSHGAHEPRPSRPGPRLAALVVVLTVVALAFTWLAGDPATESDRSAITTPEIEDAPTTTLAAAPIPQPPVPDPLDQRVRDFDGTLALTMGSSSGIEVWRWSSGPGGVLERSVSRPDLYDPTFDASGELVAATRRYGREPPSLRVGSDGQLSPVFWGAYSYRWHSTRPHTLVWVSQATSEDPPLIHAGRWIGDGVYFKPVGSIPGFDFRDGRSRLVGYDDDGLLIEDWGARQELTTITRTTLEGVPVATVDGWLVGTAASGQIAVASDGNTAVFDAATLTMVATLPAQYSSVAWTDDGRIAAAHFESTIVDLIDGSAVRSVDIGQVRPMVLGWTDDGRFVLVAGHAEEQPVLVFVDTATLDTTTLFVSGHPIAAVALP